MLEKEKEKRKDDVDADLFRIFSSVFDAFSVVKDDDDSDDENAHLYSKEANEENVHREKRFGEFRRRR